MRRPASRRRRRSVFRLTPHVVWSLLGETCVEWSMARPVRTRAAD